MTYLLISYKSKDPVFCTGHQEGEEPYRSTSIVSSSAYGATTLILEPEFVNWMLNAVESAVANRGSSGMDTR